MKQLFDKIENCCTNEIKRRNHQLIKEIKDILPDIMEFTNIILDESNFDMDTETYQLIRSQYVEIVGDLMDGIENQDEVLVMDALYVGMLDFMRLFSEDLDEERA